ncbi:cyclic nucleotide-binding domain protein, partial [Vibrio harveyi]
ITHNVRIPKYNVVGHHEHFLLRAISAYF